MKELCKLIIPYRCKKCNEDMLFFTTNNNILIDYKRIYELYDNAYSLKQYLYTKNIKYLKCLVCNQLYIIDWTTGFPTQLTNKEYIEKFGV